MQKTQWSPPFEFPRAPLKFPLVLMLSLLSALLRPRRTLFLETRTNCILCTWHWTVGTSFRSLMQAESRSMDARTTVSLTFVDFKESSPRGKSTWVVLWSKWLLTVPPNRLIFSISILCCNFPSFLVMKWNSKPLRMLLEEDAIDLH